MDTTLTLTTGFFTDTTSWHLAEKACTLFPVYRDCLRAAPTSCQSTSTYSMWQSLETYICELLLPTVRDHHQSCFSRFANITCPSHRILSTSTPICKLMLSVYNQLDCIDMISARCEQSTLDMIEPLRTDTNTFDSQFTCTQEQTIVGSVNNSSPDDYDDDEDVFGRDESTPITSNIFRLLTRLSSVCRASTNGHWQPAIDILCADTSTASHNLNCFRAMNNRDCNATSHVESTCSAVSAMNQFIDCSIANVNDECDIDAQNYIISIQEKLSDIEIANKCYETNDDEEEEESVGFHVHPTNPRCSSEQENVAVVCLVELLELQKHLGLLQSRNLLVELSENNSTILANVCAVYSKYEQCLNDTVFVRNGGKRCAFNSPLNTLARVGLGPICRAYERRQFVDHRKCIMQLASAGRLDVCGGELHKLGIILRQMLQGHGHGEILLCQAYYLIRDLFGCVEPTMRDECGNDAVENLLAVKASITELGVEEGCPAERPDDFDNITMTTTTIAPQSSIDDDAVESAPIAHPIPTASHHICETDEQERFSVCIQPLTAMQPHPLTVIRQPRLIADACLKFAQFLDCRQNVSCRPLWSQGMTAMFRYACGDGKEEYLKVILTFCCIL